MLQRNVLFGGVIATRLEGWGFLCLIGCAVTVTLLSGGWQVGGTLDGVVIGVLAGDIGDQ
ncbi:MAG: hypothetical protein RJB11_259 [Planctomycetota bacterium]